MSKRRREGTAEIPCIIFLATAERDSFARAEKAENRQLSYIHDFLWTHRLCPVKIIRRGCMGNQAANRMFEDCIGMMKEGKARAVVVANMVNISTGVADAVSKVGRVQAAGGRIFSVDDGSELKLQLKGFEKVKGHENRE